MTEYAYLNKTGHILNVSTTQKTLEEVKASAFKPIGTVDVKRLDDVSLRIKQQYQYWSERP